MMYLAYLCWQKYLSNLKENVDKDTDGDASREKEWLKFHRMPIACNQIYSTYYFHAEREPRLYLRKLFIRMGICLA